MKKQITILCAIIFSILLLSLLAVFINDDIGRDWYMYLIIALLFLVFPSLIISLIITAIFPKTTTKGFLRILIITNSISLSFLALGDIILVLALFKPQKNFAFNNFDTNTGFVDQFKYNKDSLLIPALDTFENQKDNLDNFRILDIDYARIDSVINLDTSHYYSVDIYYFKGKQAATDNFFVLRQIVLPNHKVQRIFEHNIAPDTAFVRRYSEETMGANQKKEGNDPDPQLTKIRKRWETEPTNKLFYDLTDSQIIAGRRAIEKELKIKLKR